VCYKIPFSCVVVTLLNHSMLELKLQELLPPCFLLVHLSGLVLSSGIWISSVVLLMIGFFSLRVLHLALDIDRCNLHPIYSLRSNNAVVSDKRGELQNTCRFMSKPQ
jgi:hypothetical protein